MPQIDGQPIEATDATAVQIALPGCALCSPNRPAGAGDGQSSLHGQRSWGPRSLIRLDEDWRKKIARPLSDRLLSVQKECHN
jgi:hypothetical protein